MAAKIIPRTHMDQLDAIPIPKYYELCNALLSLQGAIRLADVAVHANMGVNQDLVAANGVLQLAEAEVERIYAIVSMPAVMNAWPDRSTEVAHA